MLIDTEQHPITISLVYYLFFVLTGIVLRAFIKQHVPERYQLFWLYVVTTFSVLGCSLENRHIRAQHGTVAYVLVLYILSLRFSLAIHDSSPNPISNVISFARGKYSFGLVLWLTLAQILGAALAYRTARTFWGFGLSKYHRQRFLEECRTDLSVSLVFGLFVESVGAAIQVLMNVVVLSRAIQFEVAVKNLVMCLLTVAVIHWTGFYINPMNASNQSFGCKGTSVQDHLLVYWIGPCVSAYFTYVAFSRIRKLFRAQKESALIKKVTEDSSFISEEDQPDTLEDDQKIDGISHQILANDTQKDVTAMRNKLKQA